jgi:hypothetical protein
MFCTGKLSTKKMTGIPWPKLSSDLPPTFKASATPHSFLDCCRFYSTATPSPQCIIIAANFFTHPPLPEVWPYSHNFWSQKPFHFQTPHSFDKQSLKSTLVQTGLQLNLSTLFCSSTLFLLVLNTLQRALCIALQAQ